MTKNFQEFPPFPAAETDKVLDAARAALARQEPCDNLSHAPLNTSGDLSTCDNLSHAVTRTPTEPGGQLTLPADWAIEPAVPAGADLPARYVIADDGALSLAPPYLVICYPSGRLVIRSHADERTMARAHVQAVKPSSVLPPGTRVIAVTRDGARVEKEKAR